MVSISDFNGLKSNVRRSDTGAYIHMNKENNCLYVGRGMILNCLSHEFSVKEFRHDVNHLIIFKTDGPHTLNARLFEFAFIHYYKPRFNNDTSWNRIMGKEYANWGQTFYLREGDGLQGLFRKVRRSDIGVYALMDKNHNCLFLGHGQILNGLAQQFSAKEYRNEIHHLTIYKTDYTKSFLTRLLTFALIHYYKPIYNRVVSWNKIMGTEYANLGQTFYINEKRNFESELRTGF